MECCSDPLGRCCATRDPGHGVAPKLICDRWALRTGQSVSASVSGTFPPGESLTSETADAIALQTPSRLSPRDDIMFSATNKIVKVQSIIDQQDLLKNNMIVERRVVVVVKALLTVAHRRSF